MTVDSSQLTTHSCSQSLAYIWRHVEIWQRSVSDSTPLDDGVNLATDGDFSITPDTWPVSAPDNGRVSNSLRCRSAPRSSRMGEPAAPSSEETMGRTPVKVDPRDGLIGEQTEVGAIVNPRATPGDRGTETERDPNSDPTTGNRGWSLGEGLIHRVAKP